MKEIRPIYRNFNIFCDYIINSEDYSEKLLLDNTLIGCTGNNIQAIKEELIGYIFIHYYCKNRWWTHKPQTMNAIKKYWDKE